jgi:glycolate oxidase FAD binding subunit
VTATLRSNDPVLAAFADEVGDSDPVAIAGNRTRWDLGGPLEDGTPLLSAPSGIVEYIPEEMIVTVRAGTTVDELHDTLAARNQWTSLPERGGTVGGAIAVGQNDYRRPARGDVRSSVLQVRYISAEGKLVTGGGPTVKNVSGFDLPRLLAGSLGTLGCIAEVILRTNPIPASRRWYRSSDVDPFAVWSGLLSPGPILWDGETTTAMLFGREVAVQADRERLGALGSFTECEDPGAPAGARWSLTPADLARLSTFDTGSFVAEIGVGIVHAEKPQPLTPLASGVRLVHERMKAEFDPHGRLNPGRVVGAR